MKSLMSAALVLPLLLLTACNHDGGGHGSMKKEKTMESKTMEQKVASNPKYQAYSSQAMNKVKGKQKFITFFHADWCPTCVKWESKTQANLDNLPENTVILKASYDEQAVLAKSMGAKKQSSAVFFDSTGEIVDVVGDPSQEVMAAFFNSPDNDPMANVGANKYMAFDQGKYNQMKGKEKMILFFHADWCGTCRKWEKNLQAQANMLPENARIMKVNYDTQTGLKQEYGVTKQSMAVFINADGTVAKTVGDPSVEMMKDFFVGTQAMDDKMMDKMEDKAPVYKAYSAQTFNSMKGQGKMVVFFHADWCPTCVKWDQKMQEGISQLPAGARVLKASYDSEEALKKAYGVTKQSMAVFLNADGSVAKTQGDPDLESIKSFFSS